MKIQVMFSFGNGIFTTMVNDFGNHTAFVTFGKDETRRILTENGTDDSERLQLFLSDVDGPGGTTVPDVATEQTVRHVGTFVETLSQIAFAPGTTAADGKGVTALTDAHATLFFCLLPRDQGKEIIIGYADRDGNHFVDVLFSKEHLHDRIGTYNWLSPEERQRMIERIETWPLMHFSSRKPVIIDGNLALIFNSAYQFVHNRTTKN